MKLKKVIAGVVAAATLATTLASVSASAQWTPTEGQFNATMYIADGAWKVSSMAPQGFRKPGKEGRYEGGFVQDAIVTGDGTYTVRLEFPPLGDKVGGDKYITGKLTDGVIENQNCNTWNVDQGTGEFFAVTVFCIDILGLVDGTEKLENGKYVPNDKTIKKNDFGLAAGPYKASKISATVDKIVQDGEEVPFNKDKVIVGNIENDNSNYRLEIFNTYGDTKDGRVIADDAINFMEYLEVTFTISGIDAQKNNASTTGTTGTTSSNKNEPIQQTTQAANVNNGGSSTTTTTSSSTGADTGATAGLALGGIALAGVAVVLAKKRK